ncbi:radical SAM family heme chaperone HemW [Paludibacter sp.]
MGDSDEKTVAFLNALIEEINQRSNYLNGESIQTIYFGGGTPSVLNYNQFKIIFDEIYKNFEVDSNAEITMEANPDDLTESYFQSISPLPFNRLSIGIQSFNNYHLRLINRRHDSQQAINAVKNARKYGFNNISIDLIYGLPTQTLEDWKYQLDEAFKLDVEHISAYNLTYEEGTALWTQRKKNIIREVDEETTLEMFDFMRDEMILRGYEAYEISNYSKPGYRSRHNSAYWKFTPYLGLGPSAHSFDGKTRQWNISSINKYIDNIKNHKAYFEKEILSKQNFYNDQIMVSLRTSEGIDIQNIKQKFGSEYYDYLCYQADIQMHKGLLKKNETYLTLTKEGLHLSNQVIVELMKTD